MIYDGKTEFSAVFSVCTIVLTKKTFEKQRCLQDVVLLKYLLGSKKKTKTFFLQIVYSYREQAYFIDPCSLKMQTHSHY